VRDELETAVAAAEAGAAAIRERMGMTENVRSKSTPTDLVTDTDIAAGSTVVRTILTRDRSASFVIEEDEVYEEAEVPRASLQDPEVWVVDPLDGTTSFVHGFPCYSVSVALLRHGRPVAGAVTNVPLAETVSAADGLGAFVGDQPVRCGRTESLNRALLVTGFPYDRGAPLDRQLSVLAAFLRTPIHGVRRDGSAAVDCCHVALGRTDGFWEYGLKPWDTAAGVVICRESGARVTAIDGSKWTVSSTGILAANPILHERMLEVIKGIRA